MTLRRTTILILFLCLVVINADNSNYTEYIEQWQQAADDIEKVAEVFKSVKDVVNEETISINGAIGVFQSVASLSSIFFPQMAAVSSAFSLLRVFTSQENP